MSRLASVCGAVGRLTTGLRGTEKERLGRRCLLLLRPSYRLYRGLRCHHLLLLLLLLWGDGVVSWLWGWVVHGLALRIQLHLDHALWCLHHGDHLFPAASPLHHGLIIDRLVLLGHAPHLALVWYRLLLLRCVLEWLLLLS